jgi:dienelactone hydrolase
MTQLTPLDYGHDGVALTGLLAAPAGSGPWPAALVMHDALGISEMVKQRARELAAAGYVALVTDMYGGGEHSPDRARNGERFGALQAEPERLRNRVLAAFEALRGLPGVDARRIAAIGYCFGGQCVLELARSGADLKGVVSFHGLLTSRIPARPGEVKAKVLAITGAHDPFAPLDDVQAFQSEMSRAGADWQVTVYGEGWHAFTDPDIAKRTDTPGLRYDPFLARLAWAQATAFLEATTAA